MVPDFLARRRLHCPLNMADNSNSTKNNNPSVADNVARISSLPVSPARSDPTADEAKGPTLSPPGKMTCHHLHAQPFRPHTHAPSMVPTGFEAEPPLFPVFFTEPQERALPRHHHTGRRLRHAFFRVPTAHPNRFDSRDQTLRLLAGGLVHWFATLIVAAATIGCMWGFQERRRPLSVGERRLFQTLITGFSLLLAFNIQVRRGGPSSQGPVAKTPSAHGAPWQASYKSLASTLRWKLLARWAHTAHEVCWSSRDRACT